MDNKKESRFASNIKTCDSWTQVTEVFSHLPKPVLRRDEEGETYRERWLYRGHQSHTYRLEPSIERECKDWQLAEHRILMEFQKKARMHMEPSQLPPTDCKLSWLAIMQHHGAPARLLDFTDSPYVALYFALRHRKEDRGGYAEVWGIDAVSLMQKAENVFYKADAEALERQGPPTHKSTMPHNAPIQPPPRIASAHPDFFTPEVEDVQTKEQHENEWIRNALNPGLRRVRFNREGLVTAASPPVQNIRLSSQQSVFLFNGADEHSFEESLERMMGSCGGQWYERFRISESLLREAEGHLFQMNIHDLSLFPDAEGLTGFLRQKIRLDYW